MFCELMEAGIRESAPCAPPPRVRKSDASGSLSGVSFAVGSGVVLMCVCVCVCVVSWDAPELVFGAVSATHLLCG